MQSQNRAEKAIANGVFDAEIAPVTRPDGTVVSTRRRAASRHHAGRDLRAEARSSAPTAR